MGLDNSLLEEELQPSHTQDEALLTPAYFSEGKKSSRCSAGERNKRDPPLVPGMSKKGEKGASQ